MVVVSELYLVVRMRKLDVPQLLDDGLVRWACVSKVRLWLKYRRSGIHIYSNLRLGLDSLKWGGGGFELQSPIGRQLHLRNCLSLGLRNCQRFIIWHGFWDWLFLGLEKLSLWVVLLKRLRVYLRAWELSFGELSLVRGRGLVTEIAAERRLEFLTRLTLKNFLATHIGAGYWVAPNLFCTGYHKVVVFLAS